VASTLDSHPIALAELACTPVDDSAPYTASNGYAECSSVSIDSPISDRSADSRWSPIDKPGAVGIVPQENLVGRALVSVFSTDGSSYWLLPWTWFTAMRPERIGQGF
jgi:hypothetical protein